MKLYVNHYTVRLKRPLSFGHLYTRSRGSNQVSCNLRDLITPVDYGRLMVDKRNINKKYSLIINSLLTTQSHYIHHKYMTLHNKKIKIKPLGFPLCLLRNFNVNDGTNRWIMKLFSDYWN